MKRLKYFLILTLTILTLQTLAYAEELDEILLNTLVEKGVITQEEAAAIRADFAIKKQEEKEAQKEFTVKAGKPIKISGYTQLRGRLKQADDDLTKNDGFDTRRARLDLKGDITEKWDYRLQIDAAGTSLKLLDTTAGYKIKPDVNLKLTLGQFKVPFSLENLTSSPKLETINRSQAVEALVARGKDVIGNHNGRDTGIQVSGSVLPKEDSFLLDYTLGIFNGSGINAADTNNKKDIALRAVYHLQKGLDFGASYYVGNGVFGKTPKSQKRNRFGLEAAYTYDFTPGKTLSVKSEYISGIDGATSRKGWYFQAGYFLKPKRLQGVLKYDAYDPDANKSNDETTVFTLGANWFYNKWAFLQANYEKKGEKGKEVSNDTITGQFTLQF